MKIERTIFAVLLALLVLKEDRVLCESYYSIHQKNKTSSSHSQVSGKQYVYLKTADGSVLHNRSYVESQEQEQGNEDLTEVTNVLSPFPSQEIRSSSLSRSSSRSRKEETCMSMMWKRNLSHKITPAMKTSACHQYQQWGKEMKEGTNWKGDSGTINWLSKLGLDAFRAYMPQGRYRRQNVRLRKEYRMMTDEERDRFHAAVNRLKQTSMGDNNRYDVFVLLHQPSAAPGAHFGPAFLGWHREMLFRFENALREVDPEVTVPYWDSTLDSHLADEAADAITWTDQFLGSRQGDVRTGPFAGFPLVIDVNGRSRLHRGTPTQGPQMAEPRLMTDDDVRSVLEAPDMRSVTWFVDPSFEVAHGSVHNYVAGVLADLAQSPSDPTFFLHHAFIDCLWEEQRQRLPNYQALYPRDDQAMGVGVQQPDGSTLRSARESPHYPSATMLPFGPLRNIDGVSDEYSHYYTYSSRPRCSASYPSCDSDYLFCDMRNWRCIAKLNLGARCSRWASYDPCYNSVCCNGMCRTRCWNAQRTTPIVNETMSSRNVNRQNPTNQQTPNSRPHPWQPESSAQLNSNTRPNSRQTEFSLQQNPNIRPSQSESADRVLLNTRNWQPDPFNQPALNPGPNSRDAVLNAPNPRPNTRDAEPLDHQPWNARPVRPPVQAPTHPPEYFLRHQELERQAFTFQ